MNIELRKSVEFGDAYMTVNSSKQQPIFTKQISGSEYDYFINNFKMDGLIMQTLSDDDKWKDGYLISEWDGVYTQAIEANEEQMQTV